ncbi:MAG TPA: SDR family NAD(P)-dependent oxidoreductase [Myxococcota bacterium]|nr:SDR family NAD(P)-dependent oxidoreductase [Myxococcota bacterium]
MAKLELRNQSIVLTGASRGIGAALARALAAKGARLALCARGSAELDKLAAELGASPVAVDLRDDAEVVRGIDRARDALGRIDVLINNAGVAHQAPFLSLDPTGVRDEIELNYLAAVRTVRAVLPEMLARRSGTILNVSSVLGTVAGPSVATYSASKAALDAFTFALRGEVAARGVRVVLFVAPHTSTEAGRAVRFDGVPMARPDTVASHALRALERAPRRAFSGVGNRLLVACARLSPALGDWLMANTTRALLAEAHRPSPPRR